MKKNYKGVVIEVEDIESKYFMSFTRHTIQEAEQDALKELAQEPIINRYQVIKQDGYFEVVFFYNRPIEQYFDYGADVKGATEFLDKFRNQLVKSLYNYPVSSVEQNMFLACLNSAIRITKAKDEETLLKKANECIAVTPYTNWSCD
ncbi:MAG: hypothetical protein AABY22_22280 [Nanoarchaeota archaeon]